LRVLGLILLAIGLFGCDHATKLAAKASLEGAAAVPVAPGMLHGAVELRYVENRDVAFSALGHLGVERSPALLIALSAVAMTGLVVMALLEWRRRSRGAMNGDGRPASARRDRIANAGLALILGGAVGNLADRIVRGYVVDFIHVKGWPVFNVADIAVVAGMGLMALARFRRSPPSTSPPTSPPSVPTD
jgi:signal peptidase II